MFLLQRRNPKIKTILTLICNSTWKGIHWNICLVEIRGWLNWKYACHKYLTFFLYFERLLREKCPHTEFFLVRIFSHSDYMRRDNPYLSVFSPNAGKCGPEKTLYFEPFHALITWKVGISLDFNHQGICYI